MAKDPAVLLYTNDFLSGTFTMSDEQVGKYIRLLCIQHQKGMLTEKELKHLSGSDPDVMIKFVSETVDGKIYYYNEKMRTEALKRKNYTQSRRNNRNNSDNENVHIYFIHDKKSGLVKIGSSVNPNRRLIELSNADNELEILFYTEKTSQTLETELHKKYADKNVSYEWYDVIDMIDKIQSHMINDMKIHMCSHMENENENIDEDEDVIKNKEENFKKIPPTLQNIIERGQALNYQEIEFQADRFFNYYESNGWKVGKNPMKNWSAALTNWYKNIHQFNNKTNGTVKTRRNTLQDFGN